MNNFFLSFIFSISLAISSPSMALTDAYFATGEDIDYLIESDNLSAIRELEYELRKFVLFRKVEDYIFSLTDSFFDE